MSSLEEATKPILAPMTHMGLPALQPFGSFTLARWACKVAIALQNERVDGSSFSTEQIADATELRPSRATRVYAATRSSPDQVMLANRIFFFASDVTGSALSPPRAQFGNHVVALGRVALLTRQINPAIAARRWSSFFREPGPGWTQVWPTQTLSDRVEIDDAAIRRTMNDLAS
ncbi:hypothetical protein [Herbiconiux ginsengi]|uniref:hypothetical protein n=1 Tax=Herbiconiux ginsengi TaxID=381665 RepID=UPI001C31769A|nr:hypothetical protein [Herbiconiux ginsengi]